MKNPRTDHNVFTLPTGKPAKVRLSDGTQLQGTPGPYMYVRRDGRLRRVFFDVWITQETPLGPSERKHFDRFWVSQDDQLFPDFENDPDRRLAAYHYHLRKFQQGDY